MKRKDIYTEAWNITWTYKFLWIFGFVASLTLNTQNDSTADFLSSGAWLFRNLNQMIVSSSVVTTILLMCVAVLLWLLGIAARADLIHGAMRILNKAKGDNISFKTILSLGFKPLPKLVGMQIVVWLPVAVLTVLLVFQPSQFAVQESDSFFLNFASISSLVVIIFVLFLALSFIDAFAFRSIVLDSTSIIGGIKHAAKIIRHNLGRILITAIVCAIIGLVVTAIIGIPLAPIIAFLMAPILGPMQQAMQECVANNAEYEAIAECVQGIQSVGLKPTTLAILIPISIVIAAFYSVWTTFLSTVFTILYNDISVERAKPEKQKRKRRVTMQV